MVTGTSLARGLRLLALASILALAGCGSDNDETTGGERPQAAADSGTFPAKATHRSGTTTVAQRPQRIVTVGLTEQDVVLELGYKPVGTTEWYGEQPGAIWPWARALMGTGNPTVLNAADGIPFEKVAALRPDLIIGTNAGMTRADYEKLSRLAPTIAGVPGGTEYFGRWDQQTLLIAQALGKEAEGRALIADVKARYAKVAAAHPEFKGKTATFSQNAFYDGLLYVYPDGLNTEFLSYLGFTINPKLTPLANKRGEQATVSAERRSVYMDATLSGASYFMTPLSLKYTLDRLAPQLEDALAGKAPQRMVDTSD